MGSKTGDFLRIFTNKNKSDKVSLHFKVKIPIQANSLLVILIKKQKGPSCLAGGSTDDVSGELNNKLGCFVKFPTLVYIHQVEIVFTHIQTQTHTWIFEV